MPYLKLTGDAQYSYIVEGFDIDGEEALLSVLTELAEMKKSYESFILPVFVLNAIERSLESGKWEEIPAIRV